MDSDLVEAFAECSEIQGTLVLIGQRIGESNAKCVEMRGTLALRGQQVEEIDRKCVELRGTLALRSHEIEVSEHELVDINVSLALKNKQLAESNAERSGIVVAMALKDQQLAESNIARDNALGALAVSGQQLAESQAGRSGARADLAVTNRHLVESNDQLEQFAYVASHDLREPLRMISTYIALLGRRCGDRLDDEEREFLEFAREGAQRLDRMVLDLLEYSRIGRTGDAFAPVSMAEVVEAAIDDLRLAINEASAEISAAADLPTVTGLREELVRLIQNLVGNALKYRHPSRPPVIAIGATRRGHEWVMSVSDNGIGIAAEYFKRIFDIFQRLHARNAYEGNGIGLAISRRIVEHHGGKIWVESVPEETTTFYFTLPINQE